MLKPRIYEKYIYIVVSFETSLYKNGKEIHMNIGCYVCDMNNVCLRRCHWIRCECFTVEHFSSTEFQKSLLHNIKQSLFFLQQISDKVNIA